MSGKILQDWQAWCPRLPRIDKSPHFIFFGIDRNPCDESSPFPHARHTLHGVRRETFVDFYKKHLEKAYERFIADGRPAPETALGPMKDKIPVYLIAADPYAASGGKSCGAPCSWSQIFPKRKRCVPAIVLPVRNIEPTRTAERNQAAAAAVHELSHVFNMRQLPLRRFQPGNHKGESSALVWEWLWLTEGMAVADEARLLPGNPDWLRYSIPWLDHPEVSLDAPEAVYQSVFFVRYLEKRMEKRYGVANFAFRVWEKSATVWKSKDDSAVLAHTALTALKEALSKHAESFCSSAQAVDDVFASGYCMDSYFHWDKSLHSHEPSVVSRYPGGRGVTRSWTAPPGALLHHGPENLPPLACRYFRFFPSRKTTTQMQVTIDVPNSDGLDLKAEIAIAQVGSLACGPKKIKLRRESGTHGYQLVHDLPAVVDETTCNHLVLVVTNCAQHAVASNGQSNPHGAFTVSAVCE